MDRNGCKIPSECVKVARQADKEGRVWEELVVSGEVGRQAGRDTNDLKR